jgi:hypothetical protein
MADGEFVVGAAQNALTLISVPEITLDRLRRFGLLLEHEYRAKTPAAEIARRAAEIDPRFEPVVKVAQDAGMLSWTILLLIWLFVAARCNMNLDVSLDVNQLYEQYLGRHPLSLLDSDTLTAQDAERTNEDEGAYRPDATRGSAQREHKPVPKRKPRH